MGCGWGCGGRGGYAGSVCREAWGGQDGVEEEEEERGDDVEVVGSGDDDDDDEMMVMR